MQSSSSKGARACLHPLSVIVLIILAGCGGSATAVRSTPTATAAASPRPFMSVYANDLLPHGSDGSWDSTFLDPGAMVYAAGAFHMFFDGSAAYPAPVGIGYATSVDGYSWTQQGASPVMRSQSVAFASVAIFVTSALVRPDGTWLLYFEAVNTGSSTPAFSPGNSIGRATAPGPAGPWTVDPTPVLRPGPAPSWDDITVAHPSVLLTPTGYIMYYAGVGDDGVARIGMATSSDGVHWTKRAGPASTDPRFRQSTPVLQPGEGAAWDANGVMDPSALQTPDGWVMSYRATIPANGPVPIRYDFGFATSQDGTSWTKLAANPALSSSGYGWQGVYLSTLVYHAGTYFLLFDGGVGAGGNRTNIYLATHNGALGS
jgi:hypothetical protein